MWLEISNNEEEEESTSCQKILPMIKAKLEVCLPSSNSLTDWPDGKTNNYENWLD